jgi:putative ABC transport system substrate-binding protein
MRRREFIAGLGSAAAWPVVARAQQPDRMLRIGVLMNGAATETEVQSELAAFVQGLRQLGGKDDGYVWGRRLNCQSCESAEGYDHRYAAADEIGCKRGQSIVLPLRPTVFKHNVLALDIPVSFRPWRNATVKSL